MSGPRPKSEGHLAEQHLGDRLSALVDGELGHDARERVLAHVATCPKCRAEVDAQRRLKNVFAKAAGPAPSESLLARLQGLPGGDGSPPGGDALSGFADLAERFGGTGISGTTRTSGSSGTTGTSGTTGAFGVKRGGRFEFEYAPSRAHASWLPAPSAPGRGFRIHDVGRQDPDRSASRGLRFAFAAAGAVSLAAVALGGVTTGTPDSTAEARGGSGAGSNVTPARTQGAGSATAPETQRRRSLAPMLGQATGQGSTGVGPMASTSVSAPLLPGLPAPSAGPDDALTTPVMAGAVAMSPLIRPFDAVPPVALSSWTTAAEVTAPGLLAAPVPAPAPPPATAPSASPAASSFPFAP